MKIDDRSGFTLIEVMMAIVILSGVLLGMAATVGHLAVEVEETSSRTEAIQLAESRITRVELTPRYDSLETWYEAAETDVADTGYTRETTITHQGGASDAMDHKVITVTVSGDGLNPPVSRTTVVAAP